MFINLKAKFSKFSKKDNVNRAILPGGCVYKNKTMLITGGTGTFGNAVFSRMIENEFREIRIFSRDEKKQDDMRKRYYDSKLRFYIGDVRDSYSLLDAMQGVDFVFHAGDLALAAHEGHDEVNLLWRQLAERAAGEASFDRGVAVPAVQPGDGDFAAAKRAAGGNGIHAWLLV